MSDFQGKFLWYELLTTDVEAAKAFYTEVVGWNLKEWTELEQPYQMIVAGERPVGGMMPLPDEAKAMGAPPHWVAYVGAADVDATAARAQKMGGKVYAGPFDVPKVGRLAVLGDPQGATIACYRPEGDWQSMVSTEFGPGTFSWNELNTSDVGAAWGFYAELFGWAKHDAMDMGPMGTYQMYGAPGGEMPYGGMMTLPAEMKAPPHWMHYVMVPDLDASLALVTQRGGQVLNGPMEVPGGDHVAQCMDPQGAAFALHGHG